MNMNRLSMTDQSFEMNSTVGDNSAYFSAIDTDDDSDKTIENIDAPSPPVSHVVSKKTPNRASLFNAMCVNRYSSLTKSTIHREFQRAVTNSDKNDSDYKGSSSSVKNDQNGVWLVTDINDVDNKENRVEIGTGTSSDGASEQTKVTSTKATSTAVGKTVLGATVDQVSVVDVAVAAQSSDEGQVAVNNTVVKESPPTEDKSSAPAANRPVIKNPKQKLMDDIKKHRNRMTMYSRPTSDKAAPAPKPINTRKSMAVMRSVIAKARRSINNEQKINQIAAKTGKEIEHMTQFCLAFN